MQADLSRITVGDQASDTSASAGNLLRGRRPRLRWLGIAVVDSLTLNGEYAHLPARPDCALIHSHAGGAIRAVVGEEEKSRHVWTRHGSVPFPSLVAENHDT